MREPEFVQLQFGLMMLGDHWYAMVMVQDVLYSHLSVLMLPGGEKDQFRKILSGEKIG